MHHRRPFPSLAPPRRSAFDRRARFAMPEGRGRLVAGAGVALVVVYVIGLVAGPPRHERDTSGIQAAALAQTPPIFATTTTLPPPTEVTASATGHAMPTPLTRTAALYDGANVLVLGGRTSQNKSVTTVQRYDPATGAFANVASLVEPLHDLGAVVVNGKPVVAGGADAKPGAAIQGFVSGKLVRIGILPEFRADMGAAVVGGSIFLVGGYEGSYDPPNTLVSTDGGSTFRVLAALPSANRGGALVAFGDQLYLIGGEANGKQVARILRIDPTTGAAAQIGTLPAALSEATAFVLEGSIFVAGGRLGAEPTAQVLRLDPTTGTTTVAGALPEPVANASVAVVGDTAYLFGGDAGPAKSAVVSVRAVRGP